MKLHLPLTLRASLLSAACLLAAGATHADDDSSTGTMAYSLGNTLCIGDSISHGFNVQPYRWFLFKNLVDIGVSQTEVGIQTGYYHSSISTASTYGSGTFENLHATQSGITAQQVAGEGTGKFDGSGLADWLGVSDDYSGSYLVHSAADPTTLAVPDTAFIMIGTNDIFNATGVGYLNNTTLATHTANMTRYLETMVAALREANAGVNIVINSIPTWSENRATNSNGSAENYAALASLNASIQEWAEAQEGVTYADINKGMVDVANTSKPGAADVAFCSDTQHPNAQGNLLIAGNMAQQLGLAGRTAGQLRVDAQDTAVFTHQAGGILEGATAAAGVTLSGNGLELASGATLSTAWDAADDLSNGFTVDFSFANGLGNGATDGWNSSSNFSLSVGDGTNSGTINVNEAYIQWGSTILYSMDTSTLTDSLRVAYVYGNASQGLSSGFYVWMGDMLIGEALGSSGSTNGLSLTNGSGNTLSLTHLSLAAGAWAPTSEGISNGNPLIVADAEVPVYEFSMTMPTGTSSGNTRIRNNVSNIPSGHALHVTVTGGTVPTQYIIGNEGAYTGDIHITLTGETNTASTVTNDRNILNYKSQLTGSISLLIDEGFTSSTTWGAFVGAEADSGVVTGNVGMEFASSSLVLGSSTGVCAGISAAGTRGKNIGGTVSLLFRAGTFNGIIYGGDMDTSSTLGVSIGSTQVTLEGGIFKGNVYAGGRGGTIQNGASLTIGGNAVMESTVTLLSAGGLNNGAVLGGTTLTVKDTQDASAFAAYSGTLDGGATLVTGTRALRFDNVQLSSVKATLQNFDALSLTGKSDVALSSLGGASTLSVEAGSRLALTGGEHTAVVLNSGAVAVQAGASLTVDGAGQDGNLFGRYEVNGGSLTITDYDHLSTAIAISSGSLSNANGTNLDGGVSINATGAVALSGVALGNISSLSVQEGGSVCATLDEGAVALNGISALTVATDATGNKTTDLSVNSATLNMGSTNTSTPFAGLALGEAGSLSAGALNLVLDSALSSSLTTTGEGRLWVNQGSLSAEAVNLSATLAGTQTITFTSIGSEGGASYVGYRVYSAQELGTSTTAALGTGATVDGTATSAIANAAISAAGTAASGGNVAISVNGGTIVGNCLAICNGGYLGDLHTELDGTFILDSSTNATVLQYSGTLRGSNELTIARDFQAQTSGGEKATMGAFIGAIAQVQGDVSMEFSSAHLTVNSGKSSYSGCAIAGTYGGNVGGDISITVNAGEFTGKVAGAMLNKATVVSGDTSVTLSGGSVTGDVYGGNGNSAAGTIKGSSSVSITGDAAISGNIYAGSNGGSIEGDTRLTIREVAEGDHFATYSGTLNGGTTGKVAGTRTLHFENADFNAAGATVTNFDAVELTGLSSVSLSSLGGATILSVDEGSSVELTADTELTLEEAVLTIGMSNADSAILRLASNLSVETLTLNLSDEFCRTLISNAASAPAMSMALGEDGNDGWVSTPTAYTTQGLKVAEGELSAGSVNIITENAYEGYSFSAVVENVDGSSFITYTVSQSGNIPEPTTATLSLLALAALTARRRRR